MADYQQFKIGDCQVTPLEYTIKFPQQDKQSLQPKFIEVLCYLAEHYPRVIPRDELIDKIWAGNHYVGEKALTNAVWHLRQKLVSVDKSQPVIETIRKGGYRLLIEPEFQRDAVPNRQLPHNVLTSKKFTLAFALLVVVGITSLMVVKPRSPDPRLTDIAVEQITRLPGQELFSAPSPDGSKVAFRWINKGQDNLFIKDRNNPQLAPQQITFGDSVVNLSTWSNDGRYLYFARKDRQNRLCEIVQYRVETNQEEIIATCPLKGGYYYIDISPDDTVLAVYGHNAPAQDSGIYFIDLNSKERDMTRFSCSKDCGYRERDFAFSPDGKHIAVTRRVNRFNENIYLIDLDSRQTTQLTKGHDDIVGLTWEPTGTKLVYAEQRADVRRGYVLDINTKQKTSIPIEGFSYPRFSKQTGELFYQQRTEKYLLASLVLTTDVASSPFPVIESKFNHKYPHFSQQAQKLAYVSNESGFYELWIANADGSQRQQLTQLQQATYYPRWSHAGDKIAFVATTDDRQADKIYIYDLNMQTLSMLSSPHKAHDRPTWTWDDAAIISAVTENGDTDLHAIWLTSGKSQRLTYTGARYGVATGPDTLMYTGSAEGLWHMKVDYSGTLIQGEPELLIGSHEFDTPFSWHNTSDEVFFRKTYSDYYLLSRFDLKSKRLEPLIRLPKSQLGANTTMTLLPQTNELLFTQSNAHQSDIKKLDLPLL